MYISFLSKYCKSGECGYKKDHSLLSEATDISYTKDSWFLCLCIAQCTNDSNLLFYLLLLRRFKQLGLAPGMN